VYVVISAFLALTVAILLAAPYALFSFLSHFGGFRKNDEPLPDARSSRVLESLPRLFLLAPAVRFAIIAA
jgi:hypothetical protein